MASLEARADDIAAGLSAIGLTAHVTHHDDHSCVEAEVPGAISDGSWQELLAVLETADWFGLVNSSENGLTVWANVSKEAPATVTTVRGQSRQL